MSDKLSQSQKLLHDSLFELYIEGGLELFQAGTRGMTLIEIIQPEQISLKGELGVWAKG